MRQLWLQFGILIALWLVLVTVMLSPEPKNSYEVAHPHFTEMDQGGGSGLERHGSILFLGFLFGSLVISLLVSLLAFGAGTRGRNRFKPWIFLVGGLLFVGVFTMMCLAYRESLEVPEIAFIGPFPAATSWLVFGIWLFPLYFVRIYVLMFDRWFMTPQDLEMFNQLVVQAREQTKGRDS